MSTYDNTNRGQIWRNTDKQQEKDRDFKGSINIEGVEYWLSGWVRKPNENPNAPAVRFSVQPKEQVHNQGYQQTQQVLQQTQQQAPRQQQRQQQQAPQQQQQQGYQQAPQQQQQPQPRQNANYTQQSTAAPQQEPGGFDGFDDLESDIPF